MALWEFVGPFGLVDRFASNNDQFIVRKIVKKKGLFGKKISWVAMLFLTYLMFLKICFRHPDSQIHVDSRGSVMFVSQFSRLLFY